MSPLRTNVIHEIVRCTVMDLQPEVLIKQSFAVNNRVLNFAREAIPLNGEIFVWGIGKAGRKYVEQLVSLLRNQGYSARGMVLMVGDQDEVNEHTTYYAARPTAANWPQQIAVDKTKLFLAALAELQPEDTCLGFISGGASAMLCLPHPHVGLVLKQQLVQELFQRGASIQTINRIRTLLSLIKGGELLNHLPANSWQFLLSDVVGDDLATIGSGPTVPVQVAAEPIIAELKHYGLTDFLPTELISRLASERSHRLKKIVTPPRNFLLANNTILAAGFASHARRFGYDVEIKSLDVADEVTTLAERLRKFLPQVNRGKMYIWAGESTVEAKDPMNRGGRNQHLALLMAQYLPDYPKVSVLCLGSDGEDGPTDAAGALVNARLLRSPPLIGRSIEDHLAHYSSYDYFKDSKAHIKTGPTNTNLMDLYVLFNDD